ncbi:3-ketoacyl-CoA synthase 19-like [Miscanthus floridulus]|uniref:3-ketoacyl-CoA synthase 19-like n=1 Tax=Miscanthus floridulus TaxID=154761 RepID=UPI00345A40BC
MAASRYDGSRAAARASSCGGANQRRRAGRPPAACGAAATDAAQQLSARHDVSTFHPASSLASRIVRAHGMRDDVAAYNLSGMGSAAVLIDVDLARSTMHARSRSQSPRRPTLTLVVSAECITPNCYAGVDRSMMLGHCLFRCGGSAVLLTIDPALRGRAKMELRVVESTTIAAADDAHSAIVQHEDDDGLVGISLSKLLPKVAVQAFAANMTRLAPRILPVRELALFAAVVACRKLLRRLPQSRRPVGYTRMIADPTQPPFYFLNITGAPVGGTILAAQGLTHAAALEPSYQDAVWETRDSSVRPKPMSPAVPPNRPRLLSPRPNTNPSRLVPPSAPVSVTSTSRLKDPSPYASA